jgi:hypothetical protein
MMRHLPPILVFFPAAQLLVRLALRVIQTKSIDPQTSLRHRQPPQESQPLQLLREPKLPTKHITKDIQHSPMTRVLLLDRLRLPLKALEQDQATLRP